jgi:hypothetical protein
MSEEKQKEVKKITSEDTLIGDLIEIGDLRIYSSNSDLNQIVGVARGLLRDKVVYKYLNISIPKKKLSLGL